jgi:predicted ribosome quality control (RQC) complex YloA/Tae2 family protein
MHINHFILTLLAKELNTQLANYKIVAVFSQNKNELIIEWFNGTEYQYLLAHLLPDNTFISFPSGYKRARNNTADVLPECLGLFFKNCYCPPNERILVFELENDIQLVITFFKPKPNVFVFQNKNTLNAFIKTDLLFDFNQLEGKIYPPENNKAYGKDIVTAIAQKGLENTFAYLKKPTYYIYLENEKIKFTVFETDGVLIFETNEILKALTTYAAKNSYHKELNKQKNDLIGQYSKHYNKNIQHLSKLEKRLEVLENSTENKETADLIMANLHQIKSGQTEIEVFDFYKQENRIINLSPVISPQKQAEKLYSKEKNKSIELDFTKKSIESLKDDLKSILIKLKQAQNSDNLKDLAKQNTPNKAKNTEEPELCKVAEFEGYKILIGKNAKNNEIVTFQLAKKDDIWLHARNVAGSHVVIKKKNTQSIPKIVIERAAEMAAFYSKAKNENLCPVIYIEKKYVRKLKGGHPGQVTLEKENVIIVQPKQ